MATAVSLASAGAAQSAVFGKDDRTLLGKRSEALAQSIGTLYATDTGAFCTAFCVAADKIATAGHCLFGVPGTPAPHLTRIIFKPGGGRGPKGGVPLAGETIANQSDHIVAGTHHVEIEPPIGAYADWAVARLAAPVCAGRALQTLPLSRRDIDRAAANGRIYQIAVHADVGDLQLMRMSPCPLAAGTSGDAALPSLRRDFKMAEQILLHTCDTGGGSSGSPLLVDTEAGPAAIALNVGTYVLRHSLAASTGQSPPEASNRPIANTAIPVTGIARAVADLDRDRAITSSADVRRLQKLLRHKNLYRGPVDGRVSGVLRAAVAEFSRLIGNGPDRRLRRALLAEIASQPVIATGSIARDSKQAPR